MTRVVLVVIAIWLGQSTALAQLIVPAGAFPVGYRQSSHGLLGLATEAGTFRIDAGTLRAAGWLAGYFVSYAPQGSLEDDTSVRLDLFRTVAGADWAYHRGFRLACFPLGLKSWGQPLDIPHIGNISVGCSTFTAFILVRRGPVLITVASDGLATQSMVTLARLQAHRLRAAGY
jgi:hypothetical protein